MIQRFEVKDFKCHEGYNEITLPGLTVISGTNNSGKSSFLQALYLLTRNRSNPYPVLEMDDGLELGGFADILHKSKGNRDIIEFTFDFSAGVIGESGFDYLNVTLSYCHGDALENVTLAHLERRPVLKEMEIQFKKDGGELNSIQFTVTDEKDPLFYRVNSTIESDNGYCKMQGIIPDSIIYKGLGKKARILCSPEFETIREYLSLLSIENIKYLKALRLEESNSQYIAMDDVIGLSGENTAKTIHRMWDKPIDFTTGNKTPVKFSGLFDEWIKKLLGPDYRVRSFLTGKKDKKYKIVIEEVGQELELELNQVGVGISQLLPMITLLLLSKEHDVLMIENPEVHLHPALQALFMDICLWAMESNRKLVIETHSEHVINRLRFKVKENPRYLDKINILFLEKSAGTVRYTDVKLTKDGKIDYWPENFFDQNYKDLLELIK